MVLRGSAFVLGIALGISVAAGGIPGQQVDGSIESRAFRAFANHDYGTALPLLRTLADLVQDNPTKLAGVQDRIRTCEKELAATAAAQIPTAPGERKIHSVPPPGQILDISIKELGNFDYDPDKGGIPDDVKKLNGCKVRLTGFMIPQNQADKITRFSLVPSLFSCCFGKPPQVQHTIMVTCPADHAINYSPELMVVEGTLTVDEKKDDGYVTSLFQVEMTSIAVAKK